MVDRSRALTQCAASPILSLVRAEVCVGFCRKNHSSLALHRFGLGPPQDRSPPSRPIRAGRCWPNSTDRDRARCRRHRCPRAPRVSAPSPTPNGRRGGSWRPARGRKGRATAGRQSRLDPGGQIYLNEAKTRIDAAPAVEIGLTKRSVWSAARRGRAREPGLSGERRGGADGGSRWLRRSAGKAPANSALLPAVLSETLVDQAGSCGFAEDIGRRGGPAEAPVTPDRVLPGKLAPAKSLVRPRPRATDRARARRPRACLCPPRTSACA